MRRFFDLPHARWRRMDRCLHLYALPDASDGVMEASRVPSHALEGIQGFEVQRPEYLHVTLQRLDAYEEDLAAPAWQALLHEAPALFAARPAFKLAFEKPRAMSHAVEAVAEAVPDWLALTASIRTLVRAHLPSTTLTPAPLVPHYSLGYCTADMPDDLVTDVLDRTAVRTSMRVDEVSLVSVTQFPEQGRFSFEILERWSLGDILRAPHPARKQESIR